MSRMGANKILDKGRSNSGPLLNFANIEDLTIERRKFRKKWVYTDQGNRVSDADEIARLNKLALPPAYRDARFNPDPNGHLQAFGIDARGRRQYRYHPDFRESKEAEKFGLCIEFGLALPKLRKRLDEQLLAPPTSRDAVIAAMVHILDRAFLRIGNEAYCRMNKSFGLTTLRNRHAKWRGSTLELSYRGKSGIDRTVRLNDRALTRIVRRCQDLPGQKLFQYQNGDGEVRSIASSDINHFLREIMGDDFSAKHFRTWHASVIAFEALRSGRSQKEALEEVSAALGNTPAIARKSYIHPMLFEVDPDIWESIRLPRETKWLSKEERGFIGLLESQKA
ncbi:MAG: DNA topoisomerase IB [Sphingorhabdus sp.]